MKTTTTTREFDEEGRLVKETVCEITTPDGPSPTYVPYIAPSECTCGSLVGGCPVHGWWQYPTVTYVGNSTALS